jgi:HAMP domain-containing protein
MTTKKSRFQKNLAVEVALGSSIRDAAKTIGCSEQTAYNLSCDSSFQTRVAEIRSESVSAAVGKLSRAVGRAVDVLEALLDSEDSKDRFNAAKTILQTLAPLSELGELRRRIDQLEQATK